ncbi:hypothetical protein LIER_41277 [Lithospermum erythrorhizon]|uniref:Retrotransposon Copia-like N-terminal domain-containing protein n=1 Tax=Lithospermum erythrorhizon TaxID=34254 RepID=A0AAV3R9Y1_LITER
MEGNENGGNGGNPNGSGGNGGNPNGNGDGGAVLEGSKYKMDNPIYLHSMDHSSLVLVSDLLTEHNYQTWSRSMMTVLQAKDKVVFINGDFLRPNVDHVDYK